MVVLIAVVGVDWYFARKLWQLVRGWRDTSKMLEEACMRWKKVYRQEEKLAKRWRDLYKGRDVAFIPSCWPEDVELPDGRWEFVEVTATEGDGAPAETTTGEEKL